MEDCLPPKIRAGPFDSLDPPFGLISAPATFEKFINDVLRPYLDLFVTAYLDEIVILPENERYVRQVLAALRENWPPTSASFTEPRSNTFQFSSICLLAPYPPHLPSSTALSHLPLGFIINTEGCAPDPAKIATVVKWGVPKAEEPN